MSRDVEILRALADGLPVEARPWRAAVAQLGEHTTKRLRTASGRTVTATSSTVSEPRVRDATR